MNEVKSGTLYLVPTPIGNLADITERAVEVLKEADIIACEDTRHTRILLDHLGIAGHVVSYHEHNRKEAGPKHFLSSGGKIGGPGQRRRHACDFRSRR